MIGVDDERFGGGTIGADDVKFGGASEIHWWYELKQMGCFDWMVWVKRCVFFCSRPVGVDGGGFWKPVNQ
jgi:hypothetical protein